MFDVDSARVFNGTEWRVVPCPARPPRRVGLMRMKAIRRLESLAGGSWLFCLLLEVATAPAILLAGILVDRVTLL